jgi:hypothetical protein
MSNEQQSAYKTLLHLIGREKISIGILATAIEEGGIWGWDRFGRFKRFTKESTGDDATVYSKVLETLAQQHAWRDEGRNDQQSPLDWAGDSPEDGGCFHFGWPESDPPNFEEIAAKASKHPAAPPKKPSAREENNDKVLIGALLQVFSQKGVNQSELIKYLLDHGYDQYEGIKTSTLEAKFAKANASLLPKHLRK